MSQNAIKCPQCNGSGNLSITHEALCDATHGNVPYLNELQRALSENHKYRSDICGWVLGDCILCGGAGFVPAELASAYTLCVATKNKLAVCQQLRAEMPDLFSDKLRQPLSPLEIKLYLLLG